MNFLYKFRILCPLELHSCKKQSVIEKSSNLKKLQSKANSPCPEVAVRNQNLHDQHEHSGFLLGVQRKNPGIVYPVPGNWEALCETLREKVCVGLEREVKACLLINPCQKKRRNTHTEEREECTIQLRNPKNETDKTLQKKKTFI